MRFIKWKSLLNMLSFGGIRVIVVSSALLGSVLVTYGGYSLYEQMYTQNRAFNTGVERFENTTQIQEAQQSLTDSLQDYRAWIRVEDTHIDYPVVQGKDDVYYASHDINGNSSLTGAIYMAADNASDISDNYIVLYGHHMDNGAMFGDLDRYTDESFLKSHNEGVLICADNMYDVTFFAVVKTDAYDEAVYKAGNRDLNDLLAYVNRHALVSTGADVSGAKKIIALSTCASAQTNGRLILFGEMKPVEKATPTPTEEPTGEPTVTTEPTAPPKPTEEAGLTPTPEPTGEPTVTVTPAPTGEPTPTAEPTEEPTPTAEPTAEPTKDPTKEPTEAVTPTPTEEPKSGISKFFDRFLPGGSSYGEDAWALLNLICLLVSIYILLPGRRVPTKYGRIKQAQEAAGVSEDAVTRFTRKFIAGIVIEAVLAVSSVVIYVVTENMHKPMVLIDKWTPLMLGVVVAGVVADLVLTRFREG